MPEKEVASIPVIGYTNDVKVSQEDDTVILNIPSMLAGGNEQEVILYSTEVDDVVDALVEAKIQAELALDVIVGEDLVKGDEDEGLVPDPSAVPVPRVDVRPLVPAYVPITSRTSGWLEEKIQAFIDSEVPIIIEYTKEDGEEIIRVVSPYEIEAIKDGYPFNPPKYVRGYDHKREDIRTFRLARIQTIGPAAAEYIGSLSNPI